MDISFCSSEVYPFAKTGGLADVCGALPLALEDFDIQCNVFLPGYRGVDRKAYNFKRVMDGVSRTTIGRNVQVFLIEHSGFFDRDGLYGDAKRDYPDNLERYQYFSKRILEVIKLLNIKTDILHCHDWQTALVLIYLRENYQHDEFYKNIRTVFSIHNICYQGLFPGKLFKKLELKDKVYGMDGLEYFDQINLLKGGILFCDIVSTVSPRYAQEIQLKEFACGLEGVILSRQEKLVGILNGIDTDVWNPAKDKYIAKQFCAASYVDEKLVNKTALQKRVGLSVNATVPLFGFVGRLSDQKGVDLMVEALTMISDCDYQVMIQGVGYDRFKQQLQMLSDKFPGKFQACFDFDESLAHQIYAGSDMFLIPSRYEPCGLSQMISMRYASIPIGFRTGGLADTIKSVHEGIDVANGYLFDLSTANELAQTIKNALKLYASKENFMKIQSNALKSDFSWHHSAQQYLRAYEKCLLSA